MICGYLKLVILFCGCIHKTVSQIAVFDIQLGSLQKMQMGLGWPHTLHVAAGNQALLKLSTALVNQESCNVTTPSGYEFDVRSPPSNRYSSWTDDCGVRIRQVVKADQGRWRLTVQSDNSSIMGWTEVFVTEDTPDYTLAAISLKDGQTHANVQLTTLENSYCLVTQPFTESSLVPGHCHVVLDRATRAVQGNWNVLLGIPGRVQELHYETRVSVESERLDVGYIQDTNTNQLHLYCNILNTTKNVTFCRFQKTNRALGYNVMDGLSDGTHSYYGDGFFKKHCGMTVEVPTAQDYGTWRCSVGLQERVGTQIVQQTPMQALIAVTRGGRSERQRRDAQIDAVADTTTVFVEEDHTFTVMCRVEISLMYCWFQHPNGTQFTPMPLADDNQPYWYSGESLETGECGIAFTHATKEEEGTWICHMGAKEQMGVEVTDRVNVRVTGPLAANHKVVVAEIDGSASLYCHTANGNRPLDYCRFLMPNRTGLSIDSSVTAEAPIMDRYYFTPGRSLDYGDCSLTISQVHEEDEGEWICAALIHTLNEESRDTVTLNIVGSRRHKLSQAGVAGILVGVIVLVVGLGGILFYRRYGLPYFRNPRSPLSEADLVSFDNSSRGRRSSLSSNEVNIQRAGCYNSEMMVDATS